MRIGLMGPDFLVEKNQAIFGEAHKEMVHIRGAQDLAGVDGLMLSAWQPQEYRALLATLQGTICAMAEQNLVIMGCALGAHALGRNGYLKIMAYQSSYKTQESPTTAVLEIPSWDNLRLQATFVPTIQIGAIAPNLGIICKDKKRGAVLLRQGNFLACSFVPELTKNRAVYQYFIKMIEQAQELS